MSTAAGSPPPVLTDPLRRVRTGSWVGGVCAGLAQRTGVPVGRVRLLAVFASALLGLGVLVYAAVWLVLPAEDAEQSPPLVRAVATLALVAAATAGLAVLGAIAAAATLFGFGWVVAVAAGVLLVTGLVAWPAVRPAWILLPLAGLAVALHGRRPAARPLRERPSALSHGDRELGGRAGAGRARHRGSRGRRLRPRPACRLRTPGPSQPGCRGADRGARLPALHRPALRQRLAVEKPPASPGARRYAWRETVRSRANRARWRAWRGEVAAFERTQDRLRRGACATSRGVA